MPELRVERWHSSESREGVHLFLAGTQTYVMGFNPIQILEEDVVHLLERYGFRIEKKS